jgi:hypothetical protein
MDTDHDRITRLLEQAARAHAEFERCQREAAAHEAARDAALAEAATLLAAEEAGPADGFSLPLVSDPARLARVGKAG